MTGIPLANPRHERFAAELAQGRSATDAYKAAGYAVEGAAAWASASRLLRDAKVAARVLELQNVAAERTGFNVEKIAGNLARIAEKAETNGDSAGLSVARASNMDIAKLLGLVVDKSEVNATTRIVSDEPMSEDEWMAEHCQPDGRKSI